MSFSRHYKQDVLEAIGSIDLEKVDQAIDAWPMRLSMQVLPAAPRWELTRPSWTWEWLLDQWLWV